MMKGTAVFFLAFLGWGAFLVPGVGVETRASGSEGRDGERWALSLVDDFEHYPVTIVGRFMGRYANGPAGGLWQAYPEGNRMWDARIQVVDDHQVLMVRNQAGGRGRAVLLSGLANPIGSGREGVLFFHFRVTSEGREGAPVKAFAGLSNRAEPEADISGIIAGFGVVAEADADELNLVTLSERPESVGKIHADRWYGAWIAADNANDRFDLYISPVEGPAGAAGLPQTTDRILEAQPFSKSTEGALSGALFVSPQAAEGTRWLQIGKVYWNGNERFVLPEVGAVPNPDPMTWQTRPRALSPTRITMAASPPLSGSHAVEYYFENVTDPKRTSGWQSGRQWTDEGLSDNSQYAYRVRARYTYANRRHTGWSETVSSLTPEEDDDRPPSPDPMKWEADPEVLWGNAVRLTAAPAVDAEGNTPVEYYFANLTDPDRDSGWQTERTYIDRDLEFDTHYSYRVKSRDSSARRNESRWSASVTAQTDPPPPLLPYLRRFALHPFQTLQVDVPVRVYHKLGESDSAGDPVIIYVKNHGYPRVGRERDESILRDFIHDGYLVIELDFEGNPNAVSPVFDPDLNDLVRAIHGVRTRSLLKGTQLRPHAYQHWFVPAGCRLTRDVVYFDLEKHGSHGTREHVLSVWNNNSNLRTFDLPELRDPDEMHNPDGSPLDWRLRMDIVYPSDPARVSPLMVFAASNSTRSFSRTTRYRPHMAGFKMRGYAFAHIDHCYNPLARHWAYGHFEGFSDGYSLAPWNGVKADSAAIRYLRKHAGQFGINPERIGLWSISKSTYSASLMANPDHAEQGERDRFEGFPAGTPHPQPWPGYTSRVDAVALPSAPRRFVSAANVPTLIAAGRFDGFNHWERWVPIVALFEAADVNHLALWMEDAAHDLPFGRSPVLDIDFYETSMEFFDQYLKEDRPPAVLYTLPRSGREDVTVDGYSQALPDLSKLPPNALDHVSFEEPITVHFGQPMDARSVHEGGIRVFRKADGVDVAGEWKSRRGDTYFQFRVDEALLPGTRYQFEITENVRNIHGRGIAEARNVEFKTRPE